MKNRNVIVITLFLVWSAVVLIGFALDAGNHILLKLAELNVL